MCMNSWHLSISYGRTLQWYFPTMYDLTYSHGYICIHKENTNIQSCECGIPSIEFSSRPTYFHEVTLPQFNHICFISIVKVVCTKIHCVLIFYSLCKSCAHSLKCLICSCCTHLSYQQTVINQHTTYTASTKNQSESLSGTLMKNCLAKLTYRIIGWQEDTMFNMYGGGIAQLVSRLPHAGDPGSNPGGGLARVTQCMYGRERDYEL